MKQWLGGAIALAVAGCSSLPFGIGSPATVPDWDPKATEPVMIQEWQDGFVPVEAYNVDTVRLYGDGRWEAERTFGSGTNKPPVTVASGSLSVDAMNALLGTVFEGPASGKRFLDLPERVDPGLADGPLTRLSVSIRNASHSVSVMGTKPEAFERVQRAMASRTIAVPFPEATPNP